MVQFHESLGSGNRRQAAALFGGRLLDGFVPQAPLFEQWLTLEQERFDRLAVENLEILVTEFADNGEDESALGAARALLRINSLREYASWPTNSKTKLPNPRQGSLPMSTRLPYPSHSRDHSFGASGSSGQLHPEGQLGEQLRAAGVVTVTPAMPLPSTKMPSW